MADESESFARYLSDLIEGEGYWDGDLILLPEHQAVASLMVLGHFLENPAALPQPLVQPVERLKSRLDEALRDQRENEPADIPGPDGGSDFPTSLMAFIRGHGAQEPEPVMLPKNLAVAVLSLIQHLHEDRGLLAEPLVLPVISLNNLIGAELYRQGPD